MREVENICFCKRKGTSIETDIQLADYTCVRVCAYYVYMHREVNINYYLFNNLINLYSIDTAL